MEVKKSTPGQRQVLRGYFEQSSDLFNSILLVAPLFVIYQVGVLTTGGITNGVDFISRFLFQTLLGGSLLLYIAFHAALLVGLAFALAALKKRSRLYPKVWLPVIAESTLYALLLSGVITSVLRVLHIPPTLAIGVEE